MRPFLSKGFTIGAAGCEAALAGLSPSSSSSSSSCLGLTFVPLHVDTFQRARSLVCCYLFGWGLHTSELTESAFIRRRMTQRNVLT